MQMPQTVAPSYGGASMPSQQFPGTLDQQPNQPDPFAALGAQGAGLPRHQQQRQQQQQQAPKDDPFGGLGW